jgi:putative tryptophan/tyrosine transport system substrate-binding protein
MTLGNLMPFCQLNRRAVIAALGGAAAWPLVALAQQPAIPIVGWLSVNTRELSMPWIAAFRQGLNDTGYVDGQNVAIDYRWAENQSDRLPTLTADLIERNPAVIVANPYAAVLAAKIATSTIPIVFFVGVDPVKEGLAASLNRPDGNLTGVTNLTGALDAKRLEILYEIAPAAGLIAVLVNPSSRYAEQELTDFQRAADIIGQKLLILKAETENDIDVAFTTIAQQRVAALIVGANPFFNSRSDQLVALAARYAVPSIYTNREFAIVGGLISYGPNDIALFRQAGIYAGRILKGAKPADLPIVQAEKVQLVLNVKTAKTLGLTFPLSLLARADEVIE